MIEFVDAFMDFLSGLRRFEVLCAVRDRVRLLDPGRELDLTADARWVVCVRERHPAPDADEEAVEAPVPTEDPAPAPANVSSIA